MYFVAMGFGPKLNVEPNLQKSHMNQISNRSDPNRIVNGQIESREAIQSRFKSNRDWDLPITGHKATVQCKLIMTQN